MSSQNTTNQDTEARGSYISIAASITAKFKCCINGDTHLTEHTRAHNTTVEPTNEDPDDDVEITTVESPTETPLEKSA